jgi:hypothetical protein
VLDRVEEGITGPRKDDPVAAQRGYGRELIEGRYPTL